MVAQRNTSRECCWDAPACLLPVLRFPPDPLPPRVGNISSSLGLQGQGLSSPVSVELAWGLTLSDDWDEGVNQSTYFLPLEAKEKEELPSSQGNRRSVSRGIGTACPRDSKEGQPTPVLSWGRDDLRLLQALSGVRPSGWGRTRTGCVTEIGILSPKAELVTVTVAPIRHWAKPGIGE